MRRFADVLLGLGLIVGVGAVVGYELDIIPTLPPQILKLVIYKLAFIGALGLLVAGALLRRLASQKSVAADSTESAPTGSVEPLALPEGQQRPGEVPTKQQANRERLRREP